MPPCPICLSPNISETLHVKEMCKGTREIFEYCVCANCRSAYIENFPADIAKYYEGYYSLDDHPPTIEGSTLKQAAIALYANTVVVSGLNRLFKRFFRCPTPWQMKFLSPNLQAFLFLGAQASARVLDVGSGSGEFVRMMQRFGYRNAIGIDPFLTDEQCHEYVHRADIFSVTGTYDIILFNHSLEHMENPAAALAACQHLLSNDGTIVVQVPNMDAQEFVKFKEYWCWLHAPYHYAIPSRRGLEAMACRSGFKVVDSICTSRPDHYLYSDEYMRDISDRDPQSVRRSFENGSFDKAEYAELGRLAQSLNQNLTGDWIAYYLERC